MLAHLGGLPIEESLIYLVPPLAVVVWIYVLGRRGRRDRSAPPDSLDEDLDGDDEAPRPAAAPERPAGHGR